MKKDIDQFLVTPSISVKQAMQKLDESMGKILFVVNKHKQLLGALTDGDLRRWILKGGSIQESIEKVYNKKPLSYPHTTDHKGIREIMLTNRAECIPLVNERRRIVDLLFWQELFGEKRSITRKRLTIPVVIMAGGKGARLDPFTKILPKPLIPVGEKTIIEIIIERFLLHKVKHFYISVNYKAHIIKSYFEELNTPYKITYLHEREFLGTAGGLKALEKKIADSFLLTNCDTIIDTDYHNIVRHHQMKGNDITIITSMIHYKIPYGICDITRDGRLKKITEKPEYSFLVNTGMYVVKATMMRLIPDGKEFHITDLIEKAKKHGARVGVYPVSQRAWIDTGEWDEYKKALARLAT